MEDVKVITVEQQSPLLGRNVVHDERSRSFPMAQFTTGIDRGAWRDRINRIYDPYPNPNQVVGCCTGVAKCTQLNAGNNRVKGRVLKLKDAENIYSRNTQIDPWEGEWPPTDTGSSGLASCKTAIEFGLARDYFWLFGGADEVVENIMQGRVISVGTWWYWDMFNKDSRGLVRPTGGRAGGHQWVARGYDVDRDEVMGRCWWGDFKDFWIKRTDLQDLLLDDGDAHFQLTV
jgi:hypothetical protein